VTKVDEKNDNFFVVFVKIKNNEISEFYIKLKKWNFAKNDEK